MATREEVRDLVSADEDIDFAPYGCGCSRAWIRRTEAALGIKLPPSYVWWLENFGGGEIRGVEIYSIYEMENVPGGGDIVYQWDIRRRNGTALPHQLFVCAPNGEESFFFNVDEVGADGEMPIYRFDYVNTSSQLYAHDFLDFLVKQIEGA